VRAGSQVVGFFLLVAGVSGLIDHLWVQPLMGALLNVFQRQVFPRIDALSGHEVAANVGVALLGLLVLVVTDPDRRS
jgi:hypothetical protein